MPRIVVAEDEPAISDFLCQLLTLEGYDVLPVRDGARALETITSGTPDLVVLDLMMPSMDGISVLKALRENSRTASVPVVITTAKSDDETTWAGWTSGCDYYLTKPFEPDDLIAAVSRLLNGSGS